MAGTKLGGLKCAETNKKKYGRDWYAKIGAIGGKLGHTGGFASNHVLASLAGAKGGRRSKRGKSLACTQRKQQAIEMTKNGCTLAQIAEKLNVSEGTVRRYLA